MRCPDCNKFVAYDIEVEPEVTSLEIDEDGHVTASVTRTLGCGECGTELKSAEIELEGDNDDVTEHLKREGTHELIIEDESVEPTDRTDGKGRPARYTRTYYGVRLSYRVTCSCDDKWAAEGDLEDDVQASSMDELV